MASDNPISSAFGYVVKNDDDETYSWFALRFTQDSHPVAVQKPPGAMHTFFYYEDCLAEMARHGIVIDHLPKQTPAVWRKRTERPADPSLSSRPKSGFWATARAILRLVSLMPMPGAEHTADFEAISSALKQLDNLHNSKR